MEGDTESPRFCYLAGYDSAKRLKQPLNATVYSAQRNWCGSHTFCRPRWAELYLHGRVLPAFTPTTTTPTTGHKQALGIQVSLADHGVPEGGIVLCVGFGTDKVSLARKPKHTILGLPTATSQSTPSLEDRARCRASRDLQSIEQAIKHDGLNVQVVRVADDQSWVELMVPGPSGSFYEGTLRGEFVVRLAYSTNWATPGALLLRVVTPVYHPTIGPHGEVAIIMTEDLDVPHTHSSLPALRSLARQLATYAFAGPRADALVQCFAEAKAVGEAMRQFYEDEWLGGGEERAREMARQWTWHYATPHGEAYHCNGLQCTTVAQLASLIAADSQLRGEVMMTLLVLHRYQTGGETSRGLPAELVVEIWKYLAGYRVPPPSCYRTSCSIAPPGE